MMSKDEISIYCHDGISLSGTTFAPEETPKSAVIIASALGVPRRFYEPFATFLAGHGHLSLTFDYRSVGDSVVDDPATVTFEQWGRLDMDAAMTTARQWFDPKKLILVGHSCGGQLFGLAPASRALSGVVMVAASLANTRYWPVARRPGLHLLWRLLIPLLCRIGPTFPARKLGFSSTDVASGVMAQWARWARHRDYLFTPGLGLDVSRYPRFDCPILAYGFSDDPYAPRKSIEALLAHFPTAAVEFRHMRPDDLGAGTIGHFGFFKGRMQEHLWLETVHWLNRFAGG